MDGKCMEVWVQGSSIYAELLDDSKLQTLVGRFVRRIPAGREEGDAEF
jgi:hypothetical protein